LTEAIEIFESLNLPEEAAEAGVWLGFAFNNCGEVAECEVIYNCIEEQFKDGSHPISLLVTINRLFIYISNNQIAAAVKLIKKQAPDFELCRDVRLQAMFHNNAGIIFRRQGDLNAAVHHYNIALDLVAKLKITDFEARMLNNLAYIYKDQKNFTEAHASAEDSLRLFLSGGNLNGIPIIFDTKALIYLDQGKFPLALKAAESAIENFEQGEDYTELTEAIWTKILCLLRLERNEEAFSEFVSLQNIAAERIGDAAVGKFNRLFDNEIYVIKNLPLRAKVAGFKKSRVKSGLRKNNCKITKSARYLGLSGHQHVRSILEDEFPELYEELGMPRPRKRKSKKQGVKMSTEKKPANESRTVILRRENIFEEKVNISKLDFQNADFSFDFDYSSALMETYYFSERMMEMFGVYSDAVVAVELSHEIKDGSAVLIKSENQFVVGRVKFDSFANIYFILDGPVPIPLDETDVIGVPVGYCPGSNVKNDLIKFSQIKNIR